MKGQADDVELREYLTLAGSLFAAVASLFGWLRSRETARQMQIVRVEMNGHLKALLEMTGREGEAKGRADERADEAERRAS